MVNKAALAVAIWDHLSTCDHTERCDYKDVAYNDEQSLWAMWGRFVPGPNGPDVPSAVCAPRAYQRTAGAAWATVYRRYLRHVAAMPLAEVVAWAKDQSQQTLDSELEYIPEEYNDDEQSSWRQTAGP